MAARARILRRPLGPLPHRQELRVKAVDPVDAAAGAGE
jgi:hypothetical protein